MIQGVLRLLSSWAPLHCCTYLPGTFISSLPFSTSTYRVLFCLSNFPSFYNTYHVLFLFEKISPPFTLPSTYFFFYFPPSFYSTYQLLFIHISPPFAVPTTYFSLIFPLLLQYPPRTFSFIFLLLLQYLPHLYLSFSPFFYSTYQSLLFQILSFFTVATQDFWSHFIFSHFYSVYQHWSVLSFFKYPDRQVL